LQLELTGFTNGTAVARDTLSLQLTTRAPGTTADFRLSSETLEDSNIRITAEAVDGSGERVFDSRERVYFSHTNRGTGGRLLADLGTPDGSAVIELANGRAEILFEPDGSGAAIIELRSQDHKGSYITLP
jgi:beta-galactosidase